jgi:sugar phosphate isomerase/epimerase
VDGLGITLDPSVYICGNGKGKSLDKILQFVCNTHLRDSRPDAFQVSVGQGEVDYGKLVTQLEREKYDRALTVHMKPIEGLDHRVELRKLRRLLETLL